MNFIKMFIKSKLNALKLMWLMADSYWGLGWYVLSSLGAVVAFFTTILGVILLPIDLIFTAICYGLFEGFRETMHEFREWLEDSVCVFQEEES